MRILKTACFPGAQAVRQVVNPLAITLAAAILVPSSPALAAAKPPVAAPAASSAESAVVGEAIQVVIGKSTLLRLPGPVERISVGNPTVADVTLVSPQELYLLGKTYGSTNLILWARGGGVTIIDVAVSLDASLLQGRLRELLPGENDIKVSAAAESVVLSGLVSSALRAAQAVEIAEAFLARPNRGINMPSVAGDKTLAPGTEINVTQASQQGGAANSKPPRVVNMLKVAEPQQVMLEVKVAEVQKTLLDKLGMQVSSTLTRGNFASALLTGFLTNAAQAGPAGMFAGQVTRGNFAARVTLDAAKKDGLIKILAEPNLVAISGQEASFLAGGKIFIPVASTPNAVTGGTTITLEEKEFGVGIKFTPTVLEGGRINLKVAPEVSELSQTGTAFSTVNNVTAVLPSMTTRRAQTTVQLNDGQSLAIAGLIKNNVSETINRFPVLGEVPILGALFRSNEFQTEQSELMFVITPRLVKPLPPNYALPTDNFVPPNRGEFFLNGQMEGHRPDAEPVDLMPQSASATPATTASADTAAGGFEVK